jgi:hypothetical protein
VGARDDGAEASDALNDVEGEVEVD